MQALQHLPRIRIGTRWLVAIVALLILVLAAAVVYVAGRQAGYLRRIPTPRLVRTADGGTCQDYGDHSWYDHAPFLDECPANGSPQQNVDHERQDH